MLALCLAAMFGLELAALAALSVWRAQRGWEPITRVLFGVGTPLVMVVFWGTFLSPKAAVPLSPPYQPSLKLAVFALATAALFATRQPLAGAVFGGVAGMVTLGLH